MTGKIWAIGTAALVGWAMVSCARPQIPQGGAVPEMPLRVIEVRPANLSVVEPFSDAVEIRFAETLSESLTEGSLRDAILVSPRNGEVEISLGGDRIEISMEGGFQSETVYRVTVLPRFEDRYNNAMADPFDLFFSTGPAFEPNLFAGLVSDRLTLEAASEVRVDAIPADEGSVRSAVSDTSGIFSFPYLPAGTYMVAAYEDNNRDRERGFTEPQDSVRVSVALGDTLIVTDLELLAPDTTAAVLAEATLLVPTAIRLSFDDYLDPDEPLGGVQGTVTPEDGGPVAVSEIIHLTEWEDRAPTPAPPAPVPDSVVPPADADSTVTTPAVQPDPPVDDVPELPLPVQDLVLVLSEPIVPDLDYEVELAGIRNINGILDGGGSVELVQPASPSEVDVPPAQDPDAPGPGTPPDSTAAPGPVQPDPGVPPGGAPTAPQPGG